MSRFLVALLLSLVSVATFAAADLAPRYLASGFVIDPAVATDGGSFLAVWRDTRDDRTVIRARRMQNDATLSDYTGFILGDAPDAISAPAVAWNGSNDLVAWRRDRGFATVVVSSDGKVLATEQHSGPAGVGGDYRRYRSSPLCNVSRARRERRIGLVPDSRRCRSGSAGGCE